MKEIDHTSDSRLTGRDAPQQRLDLGSAPTTPGNILRGTMQVTEGDGQCVGCIQRSRQLFHLEGFGDHVLNGLLGCLTITGQSFLNFRRAIDGRLDACQIHRDAQDPACFPQLCGGASVLAEEASFYGYCIGIPVAENLVHAIEDDSQSLIEGDIAGRTKAPAIDVSGLAATITFNESITRRRRTWIKAEDEHVSGEELGQLLFLNIKI